MVFLIVPKGHGMRGSYFLILLLLSFCNVPDNVVLQKACPELFHCGRNAVYILLQLAGHDVPFSDIMKGTAVDAHGVSLLEVKDELDKYGLASDIIRCEPGDLRAIPPPYIMYTYTPKNPEDIGHFVVVFAITDETLQVLDANTGVKKAYQLHKITNIWDGILIVPQRKRWVLTAILSLGACGLAAWCICRGAIWRTISWGWTG